MVYPPTSFKCCFFSSFAGKNPEPNSKSSAELGEIITTGSSHQIKDSKEIESNIQYGKKENTKQGKIHIMQILSY